jgi:3-deoxy-7-phosphoheptulonate synthase
VVNAKLAIKQSAEHRTTVPVGETATCGGKELLIVGGPCSVEGIDQMNAVAEKLKLAPVQALRGGVFKPRTSPYAFQGMGEEGLEVLRQVRETSGLPVITEVMSLEHIKPAEKTADVLQIGSRNMQNFELLKACGQASKPILLKRGLSATIEEFVLAAEYILAHGNPQVILCERGIRSYDSYTRNVLDLGAVVALKQMSHLPVIVDPSHACGRREMVSDLARAAIACGADGLLIECHPDPDRSVSDARQTISLETMLELVESLKSIAAAVGRAVIEKAGNAAIKDIRCAQGGKLPVPDKKKSAVSGR